MSAPPPGRQLALFAALCTAALALLHSAAAPLIEAGQQRAQERALRAFARPGEQLRGGERSWWLVRGGAAQAAIVEAVAGDGYSGEIRLLLALDRDGRARGLRVLAHRETPGLGDGIEPGRPWAAQFAGLAADARWALRRDGGSIDHLSGATISARAVLRAAAGALDRARAALAAPPPAVRQ